MEEVFIKQELKEELFEPEELAPCQEDDVSPECSSANGAEVSDSELEDFNADIRFKRKRMSTWSTSCDRRLHKRRQVSGQATIDLPFNPYFLEKKRKADCFKFFFSDQLVEDLCLELNQGFRRELCSGSVSSRLAKWKDKTPNTVYRFLGLTLLMSRVIKLSMDEYWSKDALLNTPIFKQVMSRDEYQGILKMLSFSELNNSDKNSFTIAKVLDYLRKQYFAALLKTENDDNLECLTLLKDRLLLKQYNKKTKNKYDRKIFVLCDSVTGYILDFTTFTAPNTNPRRRIIESSTDEVAVFLSPYFQKGFKVFIDNWWNSPDLFMWLYNQTKDTNTCNRQHMATLEKKMRSRVIYFSLLENKVTLKWLKDKNWWQLSACEDDESEDLFDYEDHQSISTYEEEYISGHKSTDDEEMCDNFSANLSRRTRTNNWSRKYFFHLVDISVINAKVIYEGVHKTKEQLSQFQLEMVRELLEMHSSSINEHSLGRRTPEEDSLCRLEMGERGHYPKILPTTGKKIGPTRVCIVCRKNKKRKETRYLCGRCNIPLCIIPCFEVYHTVSDY